MQFKMNDIVYAVRGTTIVKGVIDEIIEHHTQTKEIVKYIIQPYGMNQFVTFDEKDVYSTLDEAREIVIEEYKQTYEKTMINLQELTEEVFDSLKIEKEKI